MINYEAAEPLVQRQFTTSVIADFAESKRKM